MHSSAPMWRHAMHDIVDLWEPAHNLAPGAGVVIVPRFRPSDLVSCSLNEAGDEFGVVL
jgi:hypothetical protein